MQTTMPCSLPPELLDLIVDHLHDEPATLKACCIVSKSWVSRIRKHLSLTSDSIPQKRSVELWKQTFPDPSNSLAPYTRTISFLKPGSAAFVNPDVVDWTRSFHCVGGLFLNCYGRDNNEVSLVQLHGFSSTLRTLSLEYPTSGPEIFNFIASFPLLEDLMLMTGSHSDDTGEWISPSTSPRFTGSLEISGEIPSITRWLCSLPGGLHFREVNSSFYDADTPSITGLVSKCSNTLEFLTISSCGFGAFAIAPAIT